MIKEENIEIDEELNSVINPDEFLNTDFFKTENETYTTSAAIRTKTSSESSGCYSQQLTPPISPQPIVIEAIKLIPVTQIHNNAATIKHFGNNERKMKPILPAKSQSHSSDSDSNSNNQMVNLDKAQIKQARIIRNRESALQSRRRKKEYLQNLEVEVGDLRKEVKKLKEENHYLKGKLLVYSSFTCRCATSISSKISSTKNASLMFALLLMIGFNIFNFIPSITLKNNAVIKDVRKPSSITSRHLLFVENNSTINDSGSSENVENEFIPLYFNQTDRIRKANIENVLNWIPQPELFNVTNNNFNDKINYDSFEDPLQNKLTQMYEKSRVNQAKKPLKKKREKRKRDDENLYNPDFFKFYEFFDEIKRKEDVFYVLSFRSDHLLLPAIENFSQMIKMNLIMPQSPNKTLSPASDKIMMMQIETIVLNTSIIEVAEKSIPSELVKANSNSTVMCNQQKMNNSSIPVNFGNATKSITPKRRKFLPYFQFDLDRVDSRK